MKPRHMVLAVFLAALLLAPGVISEHQVTLMNFIGLSTLVVLGLVLLTGIGGLTSFGQAAFVGVGAYSTAYLTTAYAASPWLGLAAGLALTLLIAFVLAAVTLRLSGHYLPLGTLAWGISLYYLFGNLEWLGRHTGIGGIPSLSLLGLEVRQGRQFYYLIWVLALLALWLTANLLDSRAGRAIRALKGGGLMAESMGVDTFRTKLTIFLMAAVFACVSGWLYAHMQRFISPTPFGVNMGIEYLFMAVIGGAGYLWGAVVGSGMFIILKEILQDVLPKLIGASGNFEMIVFGVLMILVLHHARQGLWPYLRRLLPAPRASLAVDAGAPPLPPRPKPRRGEVVLQGIGLTKRFGGLVANKDIHFEVKAGEIVALIGPNGAGKSTLFNAVSGVAAPTEGTVRFLGRDVTQARSRDIAHLGMSRTFQHVRMLPAMTVLENVALGAHQRGQRGFWSALFHAERGEEAQLLAEAARQLERVGLEAQMGEAAGNLALGQQRIMEIARALCSDPSLLLLDEPAAGLRHLEKASLAQLLQALRDEGMSILLVEHDMNFVMNLVDRVIVMDFGQKIVEGLPAEVRVHPRVREAYLGVSA